jgi:hypothetical protein
MIRRRSQESSRQKYRKDARAFSYACCISGSALSNRKTLDGWDSLMAGVLQVDFLNRTTTLDGRDGGRAIVT